MRAKEDNMAFPRSGKWGSEKGKSLRKMSGEPPSSLSSILEICLMDQSDHKIVNGSHIFPGMTDGHASGILLECHISSVMQSGFNAQC